MKTFRVALAQINTTVGDLSGNAAKIMKCIDRARAAQADLVAFPELALTGYPPEDLLLKPQFIADTRAKLQEVARGCRGIAAVVGYPAQDSDIHNAAAIISEGEIAGVYHKNFLPTYGVFDEDRYFDAGSSCPVFTIRGTKVGVNICEDIWYALGPIVPQKAAGAEVIVNINASPYHAGKLLLREKFVATRAMDNQVFLCYVNLVGGQDELVFDGASMIFNPEGDLIARGKQFEEDFLVADLDVGALLRQRLHDPRARKQRPPPVGDLKAVNTQVSGPLSLERAPLPPQKAALLDPIEEIYRALVVGARDYVRKNGFKRVVIGLSGGIDSALVAAIAVDGLGPESVVGVAMPSRFNAAESLEDAQLLAKNLGIEFLTIPIEESFKAGLRTLAEAFKGTEPGTAEENLQARIRGNILMALSNKFGWIVLTTGNKSELAMGYSTLYGDMAGGFAVIKDVFKTLVYQLARHRNAAAGCDLIPQRSIDKPPSAELRPNQKDEDSLPPYPILDPVLKAYAEEDCSFQDMLDMGFDEAVVKQVMVAVDRNEYKRRQAAPGVKITPRAFGRDRRLPIVNKYKAF